MPVVIEEQRLGHTTVYVNGGQRGLQIEIDPNDAVKALEAVAEALTAVSVNFFFLKKKKKKKGG